MRCPLCNYEFEITSMSCHVSCAFNESCAIICCPNCGYQIPDERKSRLAEAFRRFLVRHRGEEEKPSPVRTLSAMQAGQSGKVIAIHSLNHTRVERLNVLGLVPDAQVKLEQKSPTYVLRVGFTELTVEREIADEILVEVIG